LNDEATELYKQAAELEPDFALAQYNYGRMLYNKALIIADQTPQSEYAKVRRETLIPLYNQAKEILENAMKNVGDNGDLEGRIERVLENVNYNIGQQ
jgi:tetratricopeptide (TPR) repeat protein